MAFWGIEVEPGKPFTLRFDKARGRLRISKATLGIGLSEERSVVQCNVGKNTSPIFLCGLSPSKDQSCPLDLEFHEEDDVVFSVLGPRSVHLTGFYLGNVCSGGFTGKKKVEEVCNSGTGIRREPETVSQDAAADKLLITSEKRVKDSNIPKRPTSAYFIFMEEFRKTFKEKHPNNKSVSAVGKAGGDKWKSMSDAEKTVYVAEAEKRKIDYIKYMEAYNKNKAEGADTSDNEDEDEDTSESDEF